MHQDFFSLTYIIVSHAYTLVTKTTISFHIQTPTGPNSCPPFQFWDRLVFISEGHPIAFSSLRNVEQWDCSGVHLLNSTNACRGQYRGILQPEYLPENVYIYSPYKEYYFRLFLPLEFVFCPCPIKNLFPCAAAAGKLQEGEVRLSAASEHLRPDDLLDKTSLGQVLGRG